MIRHGSRRCVPSGRLPSRRGDAAAHPRRGPLYLLSGLPRPGRAGSASAAARPGRAVSAMWCSATWVLRRCSSSDSPLASHGLTGWYRNGIHSGLRQSRGLSMAATAITEFPHDQVAQRQVTERNVRKDERRRVATGANHPASQSSALRRGPGTPATVPRRGTRAPLSMLHRTSLLCIKS
jgi:hypothetical protein